MNPTISKPTKGSLPLNPNHIVPLDFKSLRKLPDSHTWSTPPNPHSPHELIPVINLKAPNSKEQIQQACGKWGVFQFTNHGVPMSLLTVIEEQTRRLFTLPTKRKLRAVRSSEGLTGYGVARIGRFFPKMMWSEGFTVVGSPEEHVRRLWPNDYATFCDVMEEYQKEMTSLSDKIMGLMFLSLGLRQQDLKWATPNRELEHPQAALQLNSYPTCPDPARAMGLVPHTDSSIITLLYQSNTIGLQVRHVSGGWVTVLPVAGALVVNCGDLIHILSNGKFKTTLHRAVVDRAQHRISVAYFLGPPRDVKISPLVKMGDSTLYRPVTWKEYLDLKATNFNKAPDFIRINHF